VALITPSTRKVVERVPIPHEPGEWVSIRRLSLAEMPPFEARMRDVHAYMVDLCAKALTAWSYPTPLDESIKCDDGVARAARKCLDGPTAVWLYGECQKLNDHADYEANQGNAIAPSSIS
jgi:hypothetical protein